MKFFNSMALAALLTMSLSTAAFAGPVEYHEYYNTVGPDSSHSYMVELEGNGWGAEIRLMGSCESPQQDIDLWVYEGDYLLAKETSRSCDHTIVIDTIAGMRGFIKIVVENENKPFETFYTLTVQ